MENIIIAKANCYNGFALDQMIEGVKKAGFHYLEISASPGNSSGISRFADFSFLCETRKKFSDAGLTPLALGGHTNIMDEGMEDDLVHNIELASFFGCRYFVCSVGDRYQKTDDHKEIIEQLGKFYPYLDRYGIDLVIELHGNYHSGRSVHDIVRHFDSPRIRTNYDTGNAIFFGDMDNGMLLKDLEENIDDVGYMHLKDKSGERNEWNFPALGTGYVPLPEVFDILNEHSNHSPLCVEIEFTPAGVKDVKEADEALAESASYLKSLGFRL